MRRTLIAAIAVFSTLALGGTQARGAAVTVPDCIVALVDEAQVPGQEQGVLTEVLVREGQQVEAGDVLARIDPKLAELQFKVAQKELDAAKRKAEDFASVDFAKAAAAVYAKEYWRMIEANRKTPGSKPQAEVELALLQYEQYRQQTIKSEFELGIRALEAKVSEANLEAATEHLNRREVKAPWAGVVDRLIRHTGDWVEPGAPILRLVRMDKLRVKCSLAIAEHGPEHVDGAPAEVVVDLARGETARFTGKVTGISPSLADGRRYDVWVEVDNRQRNGFWLLRDGMPATMTLELK
ncbi:MAG: HlyD family efflux transporter periplasmic adaptor subunit [Pirellulales bacterium]|nr:HlyD family efflux transporter periplasmic adaptor subunit [Pirellulales bacterium]